MAGLRIKALLAKQHTFELYIFVMNSKMLREVSYVVPRSKDAPEEIQRALDGSRVKDIGEFIKQPLSVLPNSVVINLLDTVKIERTADPKEVTIVFPQETKSDLAKSAYILDGQHRIEGFTHAGGVEFDLP